MLLALPNSTHWSMMFLLCIGALRAVEVALPQTQMERSTTTIMELVRLRTLASVRTSQA